MNDSIIGIKNDELHRYTGEELENMVGVSDLKSALYINELSFTLTIGAGVNPSTGGNYNNQPRYARTGGIDFINHAVVLVALDSDEYEYVCWIYSGSGTGSAISSPTGQAYTTNQVAFEGGAEVGVRMFRIGIQRKDGADMTSGATDPTSDEYKLNNAIHFKYIEISPDKKAFSDMNLKCYISGGTFHPVLRIGSGLFTSGVLTESYSVVRTTLYTENVLLLREGDEINYSDLTVDISKLIATTSGYARDYNTGFVSEGVYIVPENGIYALTATIDDSTAVDLSTMIGKITVTQYGEREGHTDNSILRSLYDKPVIDHLFVNDSGTDIIIPHESLYHIRLSKRFGFDIIELNTWHTSDGVYIVNHFDDHKFGQYFHHVDGITDISNIAVDSVTWAWVVQNVRYNSTIEQYRTRPETLQEALEECKRENLTPFIMINDDPNIVEIANSYFGENGYIAYKAERALCPNAVITHWKGLSTKAEILEWCRQYKPPYIYSMSNPRGFTDSELSDIISALHKEGYFISTSYQDLRWQKYRALGFDLYSAQNRINRITNGLYYSADSIFGWDDFTITNGELTSNGMLFATAGRIEPNVPSQVMPIGGIDIEVTFSGDIIISAVGMQKSATEYEQEETKTMFLSVGIMNDVPSFRIATSAGTIIKAVSIKIQRF